MDLAGDEYGKEFSTRNSNSGLRNKGLNWVASNLLRTLARRTGHKLEGMAVVEIGAGTGRFGQVCSNHKVTYLGYEPSGTLREIALVESGVQLRQGKLPLDSSIEPVQESVLVAVHVLEHSSSGTEALSWLKSMADFVERSSGHGAVVVPDAASYRFSFFDDYTHGYPITYRRFRGLASAAEIPHPSLLYVHAGKAVSPFTSGLLRVIGRLIPAQSVDRIIEPFTGAAILTGVKEAIFLPTLLLVWSSSN